MIENKKLADARRKKGLTLQKVSEIIGVTFVTVHRWENGDTRPRPASQEALCRLYGAQPWELGFQEITLLETNDETTSVPIHTPFKDDILDGQILEVRLLKLVYRWDRCNMSYHQLQAAISDLIRSYDSMTSPSTNGLENPDRRRALRTLALLPIEYYGLSPLGGLLLTDPVPEVLTHCAAGLTACNHLSGGTDLIFASSTLNSYLPTLTALAKQQSLFQKSAADLAAQAYMLKTVLSWHLENLSVAEGYALKAVMYSDIAGDPNLQAIARCHLADVYYYGLRPKKALQRSEEATLYLKQALPAVQSHVYRELATYQAQDGDKQQAITSLRLAHQAFAAQTKSVPLYTGHNSAKLSLWDGYTHYHMGEYKEASDSFKQVGQMLPNSEAAERVRVECINNMILAELRRSQRDMDFCVANWQVAMQGARNLRSEQRFNEACLVYDKMLDAWPNEQKILSLRGEMKLWDV